MASAKHYGSTKWMANTDWFDYDEETHIVTMHDDAPEEAKKSFELWKKIHNVKY